MSLDIELQEAVTTGLCNITNLSGNTAALGGKFYESIGLRGAALSSNEAAQLWSNSLANLCNRVPQDMSGEFVPPFTGGQCDSVRYNVTYTTSVENSETGSTAQIPGSTVIFGPFGGISPGPESNQTSITGRQGPGAEVTTSLLDNFGASFVVTGVEITGVVRNDGQPDNCGNPPGSAPEFNQDNFEEDTTITFDDNGGNSNTLPLNIKYKPTTRNRDGDFVVPVEVELNNNGRIFGDINIDTGDFNIGPGNSNEDGAPGGYVELPPGVDPVEGEKIVGVKVVTTVTSLSSTRATQLFSVDGGESLYVPRLGVIIVDSSQESSTGGGENIDIKLLNQVEIFRSPAESVRIFRMPGAEMTWTYIVAPSNECGVC